LLFGCTGVTPVYFVRVDSINAPQANLKKKYVLFSGSKDIAKTDLQFKEFSRYVIKALNSKGYVKVEDAKEAEIAISLLYGISAPQQRASSVPLYGQTGISSSSTLGTISTYGSTSTYSGTTSYTPTYGIVGAIPVTRTAYTRYLVLDAYDLERFKQSKEAVEVWKTTVISSGSSGDLRRVFPYLIVGATPYLGTNTGKQVTVRLSADDPKVLAIKGLK